MNRNWANMPIIASPAPRHAPARVRAVTTRRGGGGGAGPRGGGAEGAPGRRWQGRGTPPLDEHEGGEQDDGGDEQADRRPGGPAGLLRAAEAVDEGDQAGGAAGGAGDGEPVGVALLLALVHRPGGADRGHDGEDDVDVEAPAPVDVLGEHTAEQQPDRAAATGDGAEDAERLRPLAPVGKGDRDQGERGGGEQRGEQALQCAGTEQHAGVHRGAAEGGGEREADQAGEEDALAAPHVTEAATGDEQAAEGEAVGG